jgi:hypothetical protein
MTAIIEIDNFLVSSAILTERFICDLSKCHGACCIIGDSGAPLSQDECDLISREYPKFKNYLRDEGIRSIKESGPFVLDRDGDLVTPLIDGEECSYTVFDQQDNCLCGIELAWREGMSKFRKPISCWLYPIRVSTLSNGMTALNLHEWHICLDAFAKGRKEGVPVYRFLREPIVFAFGSDFYDKLEIAARELNGES